MKQWASIAQTAAQGGLGMPKICEGLTVLDLTQGMAGGLATMVLATAANP